MPTATSTDRLPGISGLAPAAWPDPESAGEEPRPLHEPVRRHGAVLIIEDDPDTRQVMRQILEAEGYSVTTATNGQDGLERLATMGPPCLILLDLMMPVMDGLEFLDHFRAREEAGDVPVLVVSAYHELAAAVEGVAGFVEKPVQLAQLVRIVREYCEPST